MKKITGFILLTFSFFASFAQAPQGINYQAVVRGTNGNIVANQNVGIKIEILQGSATGSVAYSESHAVSTNAQGMVNLLIGNGTPITGTFSNINWGTNSHFVSVLADVAGGTNYQLLGTQQLMSVPYSLYAKNTGLKAGNGIAISNDSIVNTRSYNAGTGLQLSGNTFSARNTQPIWNANKLQNRDIDNTAPTKDDVLKFDGTKWKPSKVFANLTTANRDTITNLYEGLIIYNTDTDCIEYYTGTEWRALCGNNEDIGNTTFGGGSSSSGIKKLKTLDNTQLQPFNKINNKIYLFRWDCGGGRTNEVYEYDVLTNSIVQKNNYPFSSINPNYTYSLNDGLRFESDGFGYQVIRMSNSNLDIFKYDPVNDLWSIISSPTISFAHSNTIAYSVFMNNNKAYICFSLTSSALNSIIYEFNPSLNTWSSISKPSSDIVPFRCDRAYASGIDIGNNISIVTCSFVPNNSKGVLYLFNSTDNSWSILNNFSISNGAIFPISKKANKVKLFDVYSSSSTKYDSMIYNINNNGLTVNNTNYDIFLENLYFVNNKHISLITSSTDCKTEFYEIFP
jgi:hypothetical protein